MAAIDDLADVDAAIAQVAALRLPGVPALIDTVRDLVIQDFTDHLRFQHL